MSRGWVSQRRGAAPTSAADATPSAFAPELAGVPGGRGPEGVVAADPRTTQPLTVPRQWGPGSC